MSALDQISLRQIRCFVAACDQGTISGAARVLHVSQPAVGMQIKQLEVALDAALLSRTNAGVAPTDAGRLFLDQARGILASLAKVREEIASASLREVEIAFGMTTTSGRELASSLLMAAASDRPPRFRISFREGKSDELLVLLRDRKIDAALSYGDLGDHQHEALPLYDEQFVLVGTPRSVGDDERTITARNIQTKSLVVSPAEQGSRRFLETEAAKRGLQLNFDVEMSSISLKQDMLLSHDKCMIVPCGRFEQEIAKGQLNAMEFDPPLRRTMNLYVRRGLGPGVQQFLARAILPAIAQRIAISRLGWSAPGHMLRA